MLNLLDITHRVLPVAVIGSGGTEPVAAYTDGRYFYFDDDNAARVGAHLSGRLGRPAGRCGSNGPTWVGVNSAAAATSGTCTTATSAAGSSTGSMRNGCSPWSLRPGSLSRSVRADRCGHRVRPPPSRTSPIWSDPLWRPAHALTRSWVATPTEPGSSSPTNS